MELDLYHGNYDPKQIIFLRDLYEFLQEVIDRARRRQHHPSRRPEIFLGRFLRGAPCFFPRYPDGDRLRVHQQIRTSRVSANILRSSSAGGLAAAAHRAIRNDTRQPEGARHSKKISR
ncbi:MAG: hypothetical protein ACR2HH_14260 [Chthoniobacterales bacterium]